MEEGGERGVVESGGRKVEGVVTPPRLACPDVGLGWHTVRASMLRCGALALCHGAPPLNTFTVARIHARTIFFLDGSEVS